MPHNVPITPSVFSLYYIKTGSSISPAKILSSASAAIPRGLRFPGKKNPYECQITSRHQAAFSSSKAATMKNILAMPISAAICPPKMDPLNMPMNCAD